MAPLMLDTSAYALFKQGNAEVLTAVQTTDQILLPTTVLGELLAGFAAGTRNEQNRDELAAFLQSPRVQIAPLGTDTAERYAAIYLHLRKAGRPIPTNDLWIAASAMQHAATLLTADAHFLHVPQILIKHV